MATPMRYRKYETLIITHPDTTDEEHEVVWGRVQGVLDEKGAKEIRREFWGRRRMAYEVQKQRKGVYHYLLYLAPEDTIAELERNFRILDKVMRFMTVRLEDSVDAETFDFEGEAQQMTQIGKRAAGGDDGSSDYRSGGDYRGRDGSDSRDDDDDDDGDDD